MALRFWSGISALLLIGICQAATVRQHSRLDRLRSEGSFRAAFVMLANDNVLSSQQIKAKAPELTFSLHFLKHNFLDMHPYPVYIFYSSGMNKDWEGWRSSLVPQGLDISWFEVPGFATLPDNMTIPDHPRFGPVGGYNHMIRFWWKGIFQHSAVRSLDYYCRLDSDSFVLQAIHQDIFATMHQAGAKYGYRVEVAEPPYAIEGLQDFVEHYMNAHPHARRQAEQNRFQLAPEGNRSSTEISIYYNNFEIVHVPTFSHDTEIQEFIDSVDGTWNIYHKRWGDAPLRTLLLKLFVPSDQILSFCFDYWHQGLYTC